jgi:hypothetical protein
VRQSVFPGTGLGNDLVFPEGIELPQHAQNRLLDAPIA